MSGNRIGRRILGATEGRAETGRGSTSDWNHFFPSIFHEIVSFLRPINDNDATNGGTIREMSLALHPRMFLARGKSIRNSVEQHSTAWFVVFCMEMAAYNNQHCRYWLEVMRVICGLGRRKNIVWSEFILRYRSKSPALIRCFISVEFCEYLHHTSSHGQFYWTIIKYNHNQFFWLGSTTLTVRHLEVQQQRKHCGVSGFNKRSNYE